MGIAPLMEHRLTFSQSSKDSIRHKGGEYDVLGDVVTSWLILLPPLVGGLGWGPIQ